MSWGWREHRAERLSQLLVVGNSGLAVCYWLWRFYWLVEILIPMTIVLLIVHTWARFSHVMERRWWKGHRRA